MLGDQVLRVVFPDTDSSRSKGCHKMDNEFTEGGGDLKVKMITVRFSLEFSVRGLELFRC